MWGEVRKDEGRGGGKVHEVSGEMCWGVGGGKERCGRVYGVSAEV